MTPPVLGGLGGTPAQLEDTVRFPFRLLAALCVLAMGCTDDPVSPKRNDLAANRALWGDKGYTTYQFTIKMDCFCAVNGPIGAVVVNDSLVNAMVVSTGQQIDPRWVPSIKGLFDFIDRGIANHAAVLDVTYDPTLGFPSRIIYDGAANAADDEVTYTVSDVKVASFTVQARDVAARESLPR